MIKLGIALPCYGSKLDIGHAAMWLGVGAALLQAQDKITLHWMADYHINGIDLARNVALYDALEAGCDWVFMIDADTYHRSTGEGGQCDAIGDAGVDIVQMIRDADRQQIPVMDAATGEYVLRSITMPSNNGVGLIGAPVRGRGIGNSGFCCQVFDVGQGGERGASRSCNEQEITGKVLPVARIGGACIAVNCGWLRSYWPTGPWFEMTHAYDGRPRTVRGEDYSICDGIWQRGGVVLCDGRFAPAHVDRRRIVGESLL